MAKLEDLVYAFRNLSDGEKAAVLGAIGATGGAGIGAAVGGLKGAGIGAVAGGALGAAGSMAVPDVGVLEKGARMAKPAALAGGGLLGAGGLAMAGLMATNPKGFRPAAQNVLGDPVKALVRLASSLRGKAPTPSLAEGIRRWRG